MRKCHCSCARADVQVLGHVGGDVHHDPLHVTYKDDIGRVKMPLLRRMKTRALIQAQMNEAEVSIPSPNYLLLKMFEFKISF